ncbi:hypothetical protein GYMLUDRAFT_63938 [Collybiopsis luxurians FD-317 M1]|uniref:Hydrophobin n=1 Tax=Collybiopsis luxurians FD-317 M1 TaxID=944289 RepID=A0A0D0ARF8_9AGAR|nr:hypothetical protein GYMLUDRAFT_63938 [Collybiopsis luxurians FD-317 M1]
MHSRLAFIIAGFSAFVAATPTSRDTSIVCPANSLRCCKTIDQALVADPGLAAVLDYLGLNIRDRSIAINCTAIIPIAGHGCTSDKTVFCCESNVAHPTPDNTTVTLGCFPENSFSERDAQI